AHHADEQRAVVVDDPYLGRLRGLSCFDGLDLPELREQRSLLPDRLVEHAVEDGAPRGGVDPKWGVARRVAWADEQRRGEQELHQFSGGFSVQPTDVNAAPLSLGSGRAARSKCWERECPRRRPSFRRHSASRVATSPLVDTSLRAGNG